MSTPDIYRARRAALCARVPGAAVLLMGHRVLPRNYPANVLPFRQDSSFLYFTGCQVPGAAALLDTATGEATLFLPVPEEGDELWHGPVGSPDAVASAAGASNHAPRERLAGDARALAASRGGDLLSLPVADPLSQAELEVLVGEPVPPGAVSGPSAALADAVIHLRLVKEAPEVEVLVATARVTERAHRAGMAATREGLYEREIAAVLDGTFQAAGCAAAYPSIVTVRGEVLHNHSHENRLLAGQLLLVDAGAEAPSGFATDVTRTWPVSGRFDERQARVYRAVLAAEEAAIGMARPGVRYRDIHLAAARVLAEALVDFGLLRGDPDRLVEDGAHAVFFPHGIGHLLGLDVHDMEGYGDRAGYAPGRVRSSQFGLSYLRLDRDLARGSVVTIEPGLYFVPAILHDPGLRSRFEGKVDFAAAEDWVGFGGIRIEDDVVVTDGDPFVPTATIPKRIDEIEALVGSGLAPAARFSA